MLILILLLAWQDPLPSPTPGGANLPAQKIGPNDLLSITVYGSPELTRTVRVSDDGLIRLPMLKQKIEARGADAVGTGKAIAAALVAEQILVDPAVTVNVAEYHSRPISVVGAVKPAADVSGIGEDHLTRSIARAEGLNAEAGTEILVTRPAYSSRSREFRSRA